MFVVLYGSWMFSLNSHFFVQYRVSGGDFQCNNTVTVDDASGFYTYTDKVDFRVVVMAFDRAYSLRQSLLSLKVRYKNIFSE